MKIIRHSLSQFILAALVACVFTACSGSTAKEEVSHPAPETQQVVVSEALQDNPSYTLTLPGELRPYEQVAVYPKVKGFIKEIYVDRGSRVKKGQLLALLEAPEATQQLRSAQAEERKLYENFLYSKQSLSRLKKAAAKSGAVAAIELDRAATQVRSDSAAYVAAKASAGAVSALKGYLSIKAPFGGTIVARNFSVGALVGDNNSPGTPLFSIAQQKRLRLTVAIPEKHAQSLRAGTVVSFTVSGRPGQVFTSALSRNGLVLDQAQRAVTAEFDIDNQNQALNGGEYAQVRLELRRPDSTVWVPASSVVHAQSGVFVLKVKAGRLQRVPVAEGMRNGTLQEVFGEIMPGDQVVKEGTEELKEKEKVKLVLK